MFDLNGPIAKMAFKSLKTKFQSEGITQIIVTIDAKGELDFNIRSKDLKPFVSPDITDKLYVNYKELFDRFNNQTTQLLKLQEEIERFKNPVKE